ncbi:MFS transporter [Helcococcus ovis]|uniref:MFS transporter n=1 Tax=Helcococcus ovis TaxID=72026 RepID=UPI0038B6F0B7
MNVFLRNRDFRNLTINNWISVFGDTVFYLALINYVANFEFAEKAIFYITLSETLPQIAQVFFGAIADFQKDRIQKNIYSLFIRFIFYLSVALILYNFNFDLKVVIIICLINLLSDLLGGLTGSMLVPIYMQIVGDDIASGMGFMQGTKMIIRTLSNVIGGIALGLFSIEVFALINALTFLFGFFCFILIKKSLSKYEESIVIDKKLNFKNYIEHLIDSIKLLFKINEMGKLLVIISILQTVVSLIIPVTTLILIKHPFYNFETGQAIAILTVLLFVDVIIGNICSGSLLKNLKNKTIIFISQILNVSILLGFNFNSFIIIAIASILCSVSVGLISPRLQTIVFGIVPTNKMGAIESAINAVGLLIPGFLTISMVSIVTNFGVLYVTVGLLILLVIAAITALSMTFNFTLDEKK